MSKPKTHKGLSKRVKITAKGKIKSKHSFGGHLMSGKNAKRKRRIGKDVIMQKKSAKKAISRLNK